MQNLDEYIENDIISFLESKTQGISKKGIVRDEEINLYSTKQRDYEKEIEQSLKEENILKAKSIFEDLKNDYLQANNNSNKKKLLKIMEVVHKKIKHHIEKKEKETKSFDEINIQNDIQEDAQKYNQGEQISQSSSQNVQQAVKENKREDNQLKNYILSQIAKGKTKDEIKNSLKSVGWPDEIIHQYIQ
ncbi:MAG: hypothetical protein QXG00_03260 [Candidatus Woesearchaeota archaeon]